MPDEDFVEHRRRVTYRFTQMTAPEARAIATWRYPEPYSFYDLDADPDDLAEFLDPRNWPDTYFSAFDDDGDLAGFYIYKVAGRVATIGLGLHPDRTGMGDGTAFVAAGLEYGRRRFGLEQYILEVAQFNLRAINVYRRLRFSGLSHKSVCASRSILASSPLLCGPGQHFD